MKVGYKLKKPHFNADQIISASHAAKRFGEVRKRAKKLPQFISENNKIDSVVMDYMGYEKMYAELETLREVALEYEVLRRLQEVAADPHESSSLKEVMGDNEYAKYRSIQTDAIPDEELIEEDDE